MSSIPTRFQPLLVSGPTISIEARGTIGLRSVERMLLACTLVAASPTYAFPQDLAAGQSLAIEVCSTCHAVLAGEGNDPHPAPLPFERRGVPLPFEDIANTPGITEAALFAWMTTSHPTMPNIVLEKKELTDVVSYILSLKGDNSRTTF